MTRFLIHLALFMGAATLTACTTLPASGPAPAQDPLLNNIVNAHTREHISFDTLMADIMTRDVIYLSEKHDNPAQHAIQHRIIQSLVDRGQNPILGFEFFSMDNTPLLLNLSDAGRAHHTKKMDIAIEKQMRKRLGWDTQPDAMWAYYWDLLKLGQKNNLIMAGLDLSTSQKRRITRKGLKGLTVVEKKLIFSTRLSDPAYAAYMKQIFKQVHCGMGTANMVSRLYDTWVARNDRMALSITQLHDPDHAAPIVVVVGAGHTDYGLGVMDRVRTLNPDLSQVNVKLTELSSTPAALADYLVPLDLKGHEKVPVADYLWFTRRVSSEDPCKAFKARLKKMKKKP